MKKKLYIALFILVPLTIAAGNHIGFIEQVSRFLKFHNQNFPQEKVYVQTDKTFYRQNEYIWYKAFLLNSENHRASDISDVLYVELRDPRGNVVAKRTHNTLEGVASGEFLLAHDAVGGLYTLVAYTNWQKNWGEELFFKKQLTVQRVITPRLLLRLDFERRAYGAGDNGVAILSVSDLLNVKTDGSQVRAEVRIGGVAVQTIETTTVNGEARIAFRLPENLNTTDGLLQVIVTERGVEESISRSIPIVLNTISLRFFPEGGDLVENVQGKVAFEALNEFGKGADVSGIIVDENDTEVAVFESFHLGMGAFEFTPQAGKTYFAKITKPQGEHALVPLPQAKATGYSLNLKSKGENSLTFSIHAPADTRVSLIGQTQGVMYYSKEIDLKKGNNSVEIDLTDFPIGIAVFTLFDENNRETAERLVFVNPQNGLQITLTTDKEFYEPLEEVKLTIKTTDRDNRPVSASLGISVVDEQLLALADDRQDNILTYLLFSSELKGNIQEPSFYFNENEPKAQQAIDYLMLTRGWRRFTWQEVLRPQQIEMKNMAEKIGDIFGYVLDKNGNSRQQTIHLIEYGGNRRTARLRTTPDGQFSFRNVDFSGNVLIAAPYSNSIHLFEGRPAFFDVNVLNLADLPNFESRIESAISQIDDDLEVESIAFIIIDDDFLFFEPSDVLDEVVVTAMGVSQERRMLTAATQSVSAELLADAAFGDVSAALQGRAAGVSVQNVSDAGNQQNSFIHIRGASSIAANNSQPLVVLDGVIVPNDALSAIQPRDIRNIEVLEGGSATAIFGARAANGVIVISTNRSPHGFRTIRRNPKFSGLLIPKREFYTPKTFTQETHNENNENTTVYWNANVRTDRNGEATLRFTNNNTSSSFRITAEGFSAHAGLIGRSEHKIATVQPLSIDVKTPLFASLGDTVRLPVLLRNTTAEKIEAKLNLLLPDALLPVDAQELNVTIVPESTQTVFLSFAPTRIQGEHEYTLTALSADFSEKITRSVTIRSVYFPQSQSFSSRNLEDTFLFQKSGEIVEGSFHAEIVCFTSVDDEIFAGLSSMLRQPHGCFEQVTSINFPNIMVLQAMEASGNIDEEIRKRTLKLLSDGYKRLAAYEVRGGGFSLFGRPPASTVLTARAIQQFYETAKVYDGVDARMTERTQRFLLGLRDGKGNFTRNVREPYSDATQLVTNAYVVYVLTEINESTNIDTEYQAALQEALASQDMYRMALMAIAAHNRKDFENYNKLVQHFANEMANGDFNNLQIETTIMRSGGQSRVTETVALWAIALLKADNSAKMALIEKCIDFISSRRTSFGGFGNTQSTVLSLQALAKYASSRTAKQGKLNISVNGKNAELDLTNQAENNRQMSLDITNLFVQGDNKIEVRFQDMEKPLPYNIQLNWEYRTPSNSDLCPLILTKKLYRTTIKRNETVRLAVTLENKTAEGLPMSVAVIGIPGGMSLQAWQLKEMHEQEVFDFYEIIDDNLVIYLLSMQPNERRVFNLDLKAEIPGTYTGMASSAYVYYTNEYKHWVKGLTITIEE